MKPFTIVLLAAALAIGIGSLFLTWYTTTQGPNEIAISPGKATICQASACQTVDSDGLGFDSTFLGLTSACRIAAGLGIFAAGGAAAMSQAKRRQLGSGAGGLKRTHLLFAASIGLGLVAGSLVTKPAGIHMGAGVVIALIGYALAVTGLIKLPAADPQDRDRSPN